MTNLKTSSRVDGRPSLNKDHSKDASADFAYDQNDKINSSPKIEDENPYQDYEYQEKSGHGNSRSHHKDINDYEMEEEKEANQDYEVNDDEEQDQNEEYEIDTLPQKPKMNEDGKFPSYELLDQEENNEYENDPFQQEYEGEGENDIDLTDEEMFQIAEKHIFKIAQVFMMRETTVSNLFQNNIIEVKYEDSILPIITPEVFIEGLKALEVDNISELELACLMNVIVKPQLANGILIDELESIIENALQIMNMVSKG